MNTIAANKTIYMPTKMSPVSFMLSALPTPRAPVAAKNTMNPRLKNVKSPFTVFLYGGSASLLLVAALEVG